MDITIDRKGKKRESGRVSERQLKDTHIDSLKKISPVKVPGTSKLLPPFDYDDPNIRLWLDKRINELKKRNPKFTYEKFLENLASKVFFIDDHRFDIDVDDLLIDSGKICALPPNWRYLQKKEEERLYKIGLEKWLKKSGLTQEEYEARLKIARGNLRKDHQNKK